MIGIVLARIEKPAPSDLLILSGIEGIVIALLVILNVSVLNRIRIGLEKI